MNGWSIRLVPLSSIHGYYIEEADDSVIRAMADKRVYATVPVTLHHDLTIRDGVHRVLAAMFNREVAIIAAIAPDVL